MVTIKSNPSLALKDIKKWTEKKQKDFKNQVLESAYSIEGEAKKLAPVFEGTLRASIQTKTIQNGFTAQVGAGVNGKPVIYAQLIEFGRKPGGFPPWREDSPIYRWVRLKLGIMGKMTKRISYLVARKIFNEGFKGQPYLMPAFNRERRRFENKVKQIAKR